MEKFRRREMKFSFAAATAANNLIESSNFGAVTSRRTGIVQNISADVSLTTTISVLHSVKQDFSYDTIENLFA